jgi:hypothetical protein
MTVFLVLTPDDVETWKTAIWQIVKLLLYEKNIKARAYMNFDIHKQLIWSF